MNKSDLVAILAENAGISKAKAQVALQALLDGITKSLKKGESVSLIGFGTFSVVKRSAREGYIPSTKKKVKIPARNAVKFKAGKALREAVK